MPATPAFNPCSLHRQSMGLFPSAPDPPELAPCPPCAQCRCRCRRLQIRKWGHLSKACSHGNAHSRAAAVAVAPQPQLHARSLLACKVFWQARRTSEGDGVGQGVHGQVVANLAAAACTSKQIPLLKSVVLPQTGKPSAWSGSSSRWNVGGCISSWDSQYDQLCHGCSSPA